jgi:hypothetical protein
VKPFAEMTEPELNSYFRELAKSLETVLPPGPSHNGKAFFMLIVSEDPGPGTAQYVANADRADCIRWLRETANVLERREDIER